MRCVVSCGSTFPWLVFFFGALLWGSMIHKHTGRWMWKVSASVVSWSWEKYSCQSKLVSALSMLLLLVLSIKLIESNQCSSQISAIDHRLLWTKQGVMIVKIPVLRKERLKLPTTVPLRRLVKKKKAVENLWSIFMQTRFYRWTVRPLMTLSAWWLLIPGY